MSSSSKVNYKSTNYESTSLSSFKNARNTSESSTSSERQCSTPQNYLSFIRKAIAQDYGKENEGFDKVVEKIEHVDKRNSNECAIKRCSSSSAISEHMSCVDGDIDAHIKDTQHLKEMELYLAEAIIERWYKLNDEKIQELGDKCKRIRNEINTDPLNLCQLETRESCNKIVAIDEEAEDETTGDLIETHNPNEVAAERGNQGRNDDTESDFQSPEISEDEFVAGSSQVANGERLQCNCSKCLNKSHGSQEERSSQEASSYSTSTSTQVGDS